MKRGSADFLPLIFFLLVIVVSLFSILLSFDANAQVSNESNATVTNIPNVAIQLARNKFTNGQLLDGKLILRITNSTALDELVTVRVPGIVKKQKLSDLLKNASINFTVSKGRFQGTNSASTKVLEISEGSSKTIGVILPAFADVLTFDMAVSGQAGNQLKTPYMDIGLDGIIDWYYLGNFVRWNSQPTAPTGLIESAGDKIIINNGGEFSTVYCQRVQLPFSKDFNVTVSYKSLNAGGDLKAVIYSVIGDPAFPQGGSNICDLPESTTSAYHSCQISFNSAERGDHMVCVYNSGNSSGDAYELNADTSRETNTAFACQRTDPVFCEPASTSNYFIKAYGANYSELLVSSVNFNEWSLGINASLEALKKEIGSQPYPGNCAPGLCLVPIEINGLGSGSMTLSNLGIRYETGGAARTVGQTDKLYDVILAKDSINSINGLPLSESTTVEIPLSIFRLNATVPEAQGAVSANGKLEAGYGNNLEANAPFTVFFGEIPAEGSQLLIDEVRNAIGSLPNDENGALFLEISGIGTAVKDAATSISNFESKLASGDTAELQSEVETFRRNLPRIVNAAGSIADLQIVEPSDITTDIAEDDKKEDVYFLQESASVTVKLTKYSVTDFSGNSKNYVLVKKTVKAKKDLNKVDVYESISKSAAASADSVKFQETPKVVNSDPMVKWFLPSLKSGQAKDYAYVVESSELGIDSFKTVIVPSGPEDCGNGKCDSDEDEESCPGDCKPLSRCGDNVCTEGLEDATSCPKDCKGKFPWFYLIVGLIVLGGVAALYYLKGKKKSPFKTEQDLKSVMDYIKSARQKKVKSEEIEKGLLQRGWTKEQFDYALEHVLSGIDVKPMQDYIKKSLDKKIPVTSIRQKLLSQGWDESMVDRELKTYGKLK